MKQYIGTKIIKAKPMTRGEYNTFRGWKIPENENPADEGYLVEYSDGYISWSPKKQFDEAYRRCDNLTFGLAIEALKKGMKVARKGWNGKKQYCELASNISYVNAEKKEINCEHEAIGNKAIAFVGTSGVQMGWLASQADMLAEDWCIVYPECRCSACNHSRKVEDTEYDKTYECTAEHYDLEAYTCFEEK